MNPKIKDRLTYIIAIGSPFAFLFVFSYTMHKLPDGAWYNVPIFVTLAFFQLCMAALAFGAICVLIEGDKK